MHTETPTILEEASSEVSLQTTQETSEVVSIESSSEFLSDTQKAESSSPDSMIHESTKKDDDAETSNKDEQNNEDSLSTIRESEESTQTPSTEPTTENEPNKTELDIPEDKVVDGDVEVNEKKVTASPVKEMTNGYSDKSEASETDTSETPVKDFSETPEESVVAEKDSKADSVTSIEVGDVIENVKEPSTLVEEVAEVEKPATDSVKENNAVEKVNESETAPETKEEDSSNTKEKQEKESKKDESEQIEKSSHQSVTITDITESEEKQSSEVEEMSEKLNVQTSPAKSSEEAKESASNDVENKDTNAAVTNNSTINGECAAEENDEKSAVINGNDDESIVERDTKEPSIISTSVSDKEEEEVLATPTTTTPLPPPPPTTTVADDAIDVNSSDVCNNSDDVQSSVDSETQVPNAKEQIPTISTVCDAAAQSIADGVVPQSAVADTIAKGNSLTTTSEFDHAVVTDVHRRRSSLPNVSTENLDGDGNESDGAATSQRKNSSPQKRPRSASTSTQVDPNHFGRNQALFLTQKYIFSI